MEDLCHKGDETVHQQNGKPQMGVKQRPWFDFIPVTHIYRTMVLTAHPTKVRR
jgi:hypothetical protein